MTYMKNDFRRRAMTIFTYKLLKRKVGKIDALAPNDAEQCTYVFTEIITRREFSVVRT